MSTLQPLDPDLAAIVAAMRANGAPPPFSGEAAQARERLARAILSARQRHGVPAVRKVEDTNAGTGPSRVPVRIYRPASTGPHATVVFFHGGGFVLGSVELMDDIARKLCRDVDAVIVSVDYRLAPEHPYPAAHDDALAATCWALAHATDLGGDPDRVAVAGESAGANLAASAALLCRDRAAPLAAQLLIVPGLDMARDPGRLAQPGRDYPMLSPSDLREIARLYMGTRSGESAAFPPSPLRAPSVARSPATVIAVAGHDPLQEEGVAYAERLRAAGVAVRLLRYGDMFHPFFGFFEASAAARRANDEICLALRACLRGEAPHPAPGVDRHGAVRHAGAMHPGDHPPLEDHR
ncbi:thioesterase [Pigmentiphaga sp. NML080357]|uniref:alpha/beta hydrolase n=1 Tax=Pigmentiphaga sp. NML080357 TaxID=2008675 RepID=UPI000B413C3A|nr:alpha/beta hydrolase [Pigmentiphaga sp. NML080357]OVZ60368.1 thioesterase [Pigmentiphaga sp. NML080357]